MVSEWLCLELLAVRGWFVCFFALPDCSLKQKKKTATQTKHFNQPKCCVSFHRALEWDHMWSSSWRQQSPQICSKCLFFFFQLTRHRETGSGRLVTTSLLEPLTGQTSRCTASQESLSMNVAEVGILERQFLTTLELLEKHFLEQSPSCCQPSKSTCWRQWLKAFDNAGESVHQLE